jgi:prepilin signal peptidase PulO-like enzyme (type II secretory pathway)
MLIVISAVYGLIVGSAINAIVWRIYAEKKWSKGRSACPDCNHALAAKDLVPVFSWLALRGKCRYCRKQIHWQYPAVEVLTAVLFALSAIALAPVTMVDYATFVLWLVLLSMMIILAVYDLRWMLLPDRIIKPAIVVTIVLLSVLALSGAPMQVYWGPIVAAVIAGTVFYILASLADGRLMGGGDVKLVFLMGLILGVSRTTLALLIAFNVAALVGVVLIATKIRKRSQPIPFGPFLIAGTFIAYCYGTEIIAWYLRLNGLGA